MRIMVIANAEIHIPSQPRKASPCKSKILYSSWLFTDAGLAWINKDDIAFNWYPEQSSTHPCGEGTK